MQPPTGNEFDLPGVTPSRQKRSRETTAGAAARPAPSCCERTASPNCRSRRCAAKVGATVGAFYSRFESKEAYFNALMALAARDGARRLSEWPPRRC